MAFMAQKTQDTHEQRHFQVAEQIALYFFTKILRYSEYWRSISYQEQNNNLLLLETIKLIRELKSGGLSIIDLWDQDCLQ
jgi:hypothetical protein